MRKNPHNEETVFWGMFRRAFDSGRKKWVVKPRWKVISAYAIGAVAAVFVLLVAAIFTVSRYVKGFDEITVWDAVKAPFGMEAYRQKVGEFNVKKAKEHFAKGEFSAGLMNLTSGVSRSPNNLEARMMLASIYALSLRNEEYASRVLEAKIPEAFHRKNSAYITMSAALLARDGKSADKSLFLLKKAYADGLLKVSNVVDIFSQTNRFYIASDAVEGAAYFVKAADMFKDSREISGYCAKTAAVLYVSSENIAAASRLLKKYNIRSGDVAVTVAVYNDLKNGNPLRAFDNVRKAVKYSKSPSKYYLLLARVCSEFGDEQAAASARKNADLTNFDISAQIRNAVESKNYVLLETLLSGNSPANLAAAISAAERFKDAKALSMCIERVNNADARLKFSMQAACAEALLVMGDTSATSAILEDIASRAKTAKQEAVLGDLKLALNAYNGKATRADFAAFLSRSETANVPKFANMLEKIGRADFAAELLETAVETGKLKSVSRLSEVLFKTGDYPRLARLVADTADHIPVYVLASQALDGGNSDKFAFLTDAQRKVLAQKTKTAIDEKAAYLAR